MQCTRESNTLSTTPMTVLKPRTHKTSVQPGSVGVEVDTGDRDQSDEDFEGSKSECKYNLQNSRIIYFL